jgi:predicted glycogen debranching enzyme
VSFDPFADSFGPSTPGSARASQPAPHCPTELQRFASVSSADFLRETLSREWLLTNGIGGYAMGTVAGALTRRYHGLLVAATRPPAVRTLVLAKLEERLAVRGTLTNLSTNLWGDGSCAPRGVDHLSRFRLERGLPVWRWELDECVLEKRMAMVLGENAIVVEYRLLPGSAPCEIQLEALIANRSHHALQPDGAWEIPIERAAGGIGNGLRARLRRQETPNDAAQDAGGVTDDLWLHCPGAEIRPIGAWWRDVNLPVERDRGYDHRESLLHAASIVARLAPGQRLTFGASLGLPLPRDPQVLFVAEQARRQALIEASGHARTCAATRELVLASDAFVVRRPLPNAGSGWSIIAGYPWFADWSRDTMIALPGLLLANRRVPAARGVLETYAKRLSGGMLPNRFPDRDGSADDIEYNSVDAPLLFVRAVALTDRAEHDERWLRQIWPAVRSIIDAYVRGTRHGIRVDPMDGLVSAGELGQQLTWMDAKVNGRVITPRIGKPIEVNALWFEALHHARTFAELLREPAETLAALDRRIALARVGFRRFWNPDENACFDVIDGPATTERPDGRDPSIRPNQILAAGLDHVALEPDEVRAVAERVAADLLVPAALRTLAPRDPRYRGRYEGGVVERDESYHMGTAWPWLLPFLLRAWRRAGLDASLVDGIRAAIVAHLGEAGLGSVSEILDADPPHTPRGCPMQAWSVAAALEIMLDRDEAGDRADARHHAVACAGGAR